VYATLQQKCTLAVLDPAREKLKVKKKKNLRKKSQA
jgi:hypothetical protein